MRDWHFDQRGWEDAVDDAGGPAPSLVPGKRSITGALQFRGGSRRPGAVGRPGKRTVTQDLTGGRPVQRSADSAASTGSSPPELDDPFWFTSIAAHGVAAGGSQLPHLETVQRAFGPEHDLSTVQAHVGGDAALATQALGATAYAMGDAVAFGTSPDLFTVAHEAAHVVQQRGGVQLAGGLGADGDPYERHADAVAERVVRGEPVAAMLASGPTGGGASAGVQRRIGALSRASSPDQIAAFLDRVAPINQADRRFLSALIHDDVDRSDSQAVALLMQHSQQLEQDEDEPDFEEDELGLDEDDGLDSASESSDDGELTAAIMGILGALLSGGEYVFSNPPLNSSGDIYHTVGFLAILAQAELPLPRVVIGYHRPADARSATWVQASRAVEFADALGFGDRVSMIEVPVGKSSQLNPKAKATREAITKADLKKGLARPRILDQKTSTALIAYLMQKLGRDRVTSLIRSELTNYPEETDDAVQTASDEWIEAQLVKVRAACPDDCRLILFNERIAPNQAQHNSEGPEFDALREAIAGMPDVRLYTLRSHGGGAADGQAATSSPSFAGAGAAGDQHPEGFHPKVQHLQLLRRIHEEFGDRLIGIYGSTSGTLDAAALIGIRTLSLHNFSVDVKDKDGGLNEQDQRELLMAPFKSVVRRNGDDQGAGAVAALRAWISDSYAGPEFAPELLGGLKPIYSRVSQATTKRSFSESQSSLPKELVDMLEAGLSGLAGGLPDALGQLQAVGGAALALVRGAASGVGMNCLIHTMVQLAAGAAAPAGPVVAEIRRAMIEGGAAAGDEMLDPYEANAGAALMQQFRQAGGFATQILEWTGGELLVHPVIGGGPVRLLLHAGNHFEPVWGNNNAAIVPTDGVAGGAADGELDEDIQRAIAASLAGGGGPAVVADDDDAEVLGVKPMDEDKPQ